MNKEYLGISTENKLDKWETNLMSLLAEKTMLTKTKKRDWILKKWKSRNDEWQGKLSEDFAILYKWQNGEEQGRSMKNDYKTDKW